MYVSVCVYSPVDLLYIVHCICCTLSSWIICLTLNRALINLDSKAI